jgi:predicted nucleic acid-binding protein
VLRYLDQEAGATRVAEIIKERLQGGNRTIISAIHWGEVAGIVYKRRGSQVVDVVLARLSKFGIEMIAVTSERAVRSASIKAQKRIPYADAFGVELAGDSPDHVLPTAES